MIFLHNTFMILLYLTGIVLFVSFIVATIKFVWDYDE